MIDVSACHLFHNATSVVAKSGGRGVLGGTEGKLSQLGSETKCCGGFHHPARSLSAHRTDMETHLGEWNSVVKEL